MKVDVKVRCSDVTSAKVKHLERGKNTMFDQGPGSPCDSLPSVDISMSRYCLCSRKDTPWSPMVKFFFLPSYVFMFVRLVAHVRVQTIYIAVSFHRDRYGSSAHFVPPRHGTTRVEGSLGGSVEG